MINRGFRRSDYWLVGISLDEHPFNGGNSIYRLYRVLKRRS